MTSLLLALKFPLFIGSSVVALVLLAMHSHAIITISVILYNICSCKWRAQLDLSLSVEGGVHS